MRLRFANSNYVEPTTYSLQKILIIYVPCLILAMIRLCAFYIKKLGLNITFPIEYRHINTRHCERFSIALINVPFSSLHGLVVSVKIKITVYPFRLI
jgi:hypothetical protein